METNNTRVDVVPDGINVWFGCQSCTEHAVYFSSVKDFLDHKKKLHFAEFNNIKSVVFEEKKHDNYFVHDSLSHIKSGGNRTQPTSCRKIPVLTPTPASVAKSSKEPEPQLLPVPVPVSAQSCTTDIDEIQNDILKTEEPEEEFISSPKRELNSDGEFDSDYDIDPLDPDPDPRSSPIGIESSHLATLINTEPFLRPIAPRPVPVTQPLQSLPIPMQYQPIQLLLLPPNQQQQPQQPTNLYGFLTPVTPLNFKNISPLKLASSSEPTSGPGPGPSQSPQCSGNNHEINSDSSNLDETSTTKPKNVCSICSKSFYSERYLRSHILLHSNDRPFKCPFTSCKLAFKLKYDLKKHEKRHELNKQNPKVKIHQPLFHFPDCLYNADESSDLSPTLTLKEWLSLLKLKSTKIPDADAAETENVILLDPDPTEPSFHPSFQISSESPITCKLCCAKLESELQCKIHVTHCWLQNKGRHRYCCLCKKSLSSSLTLRVHNARVHKLANGIGKSFVCELCGLSFFNLNSLSSHQLVHDKSSAKFKCTEPNCRMGFNNKSYMEQHMLRHSQDRPFKCTEEGCSKSFVLKCELSTHLRSSFHTGIQETFPCSQENCDQVYKGSGSLNRHMRRVHGIGAPLPEHACKLCNKSFKWSSSYTNHMFMHADARPFKCDVLGCDKSFRRTQALRENKWAHSGERPFQCDTCGKDFTKYMTFYQHLQSHKNGSKNKGGQSDNLKFSCHICSKKFRYQVNLDRHVEAHKSQSEAEKSLGKILKQKTFQCTQDNCAKVYRQSHALKDHMSRVHGIRAPVPQYTCGLCGKCYTRTTSYKIHMSMHEGDRRFKCDYEGCARAFRTKRDLKEHGWEHTGERPFKCVTCAKDFRKKCVYYAHLKIHKK